MEFLNGKVYENSDVSNKRVQKKASLRLPDGAEVLLHRLQEALKDGKNVLPADEYKSLLEELLKKVSPETWQYYQSNGVEVALSPNESHPRAEKSGDHWKLYWPIKFSYPIQGLLLQSIDPVSKIGQDLNGNIPNQDLRAEVHIRTFVAYKMLRKKYRYEQEKYQLFQEFRKDYKDGIDKAINSRLITIDTPREELQIIGRDYAKEMLLDRIKPEKWNVPMTFLSTMPGSYFEESSIKERIVECPGFKVTYRVEQPVKIGTKEWKTLQKELEVRKEQGINRTLTTVIRLNREAWLLPAFLEQGVMSQHSILAEGGGCLWAGETEFDSEKLEMMKDKSGHIRPWHPQDPTRVSKYALSVFKEKGIDVSKTKVEFTLIHKCSNLEYKLS